MKKVKNNKKTILNQCKECNNFFRDMMKCDLCEKCRNSKDKTKQSELNV